MTEDQIILKNEIDVIPPTIDIKVSQKDQILTQVIKNCFTGGTYLSPEDVDNPFPGNHTITIGEWENGVVDEYEKFAEIAKNRHPIDEVAENFLPFIDKVVRFAHRSVSSPEIKSEMEKKIVRHEDTHRMQEIKYKTSSLTQRVNKQFMKYPIEELIENDGLVNLGNLTLKKQIIEELQAFHNNFVADSGKHASDVIETLLAMAETANLFVKNANGDSNAEVLLTKMQNGQYILKDEHTVLNTLLIVKSLLLLGNKDDIKAVLDGEYDVQKIKTSMLDGFKRMATRTDVFMQELKEQNLMVFIDQELYKCVKELRDSLEKIETEE